MVNRSKYDFLSESEFKLYSNVQAYHANKYGLVDFPFDGDGFQSTEERNVGYKTLKKHGLIYFDESKFKPTSLIRHADVTIL